MLVYFVIILLLLTLVYIAFGLFNHNAVSKLIPLKIQALYIYPVKGLRPLPVTNAAIGLRGFEHDRTFSLQKVQRDIETKEVLRLEAMLIGYQLTMALFGTFLETNGNSTDLHGPNVIITFIPPESEGDPKLEWTGSPDQIRFPVLPETEKKAIVEVNLHGSPTKAYDMGPEINDWFSERFGYEVMLVYIGKENSRAVFGSLAPNNPQAASKSLHARLSAMVPRYIPLIQSEGERIAFNDLAQYLVVTQSSTDEVSSRLVSGTDMDVTKFRPNIVLSGPVPAFDEDFWAELTISSSLGPRGAAKNKATNIKIQLTGNCFRCQSITVDYKTGKAAADESGLVWKKLNKDRRVDKGAKWSPVFGRYGFCARGDEGVTLSVGDEVKVTRRNVDRTVFDWPGLTTFGVTS